ncbi:unnamed protein product [Mytilus edulis]|uniref:G-protein coupled receptors family 2 profile 2 domain-containing protein n=1 Tax=Mytilus edulis TaxID=6550 RepID=A0A8S3PWC7_MYTED|nr:unnamed protein product [Mytilus edulis]
MNNKHEKSIHKKKVTNEDQQRTEMPKEKLVPIETKNDKVYPPKERVNEKKIRNNSTDGSWNNVNGITTSDTTSNSKEQVTSTDGSWNNVNGKTTSDTTSRSIFQVNGTDMYRNKIGKATLSEKTTKSDEQTSTNPNMLEDECLSYGVCKFPKDLDRYCYCDEKCNVYKDCCEKHNLITNITPDRYKCMKQTTEKYNMKGFQTISMCSLEYHDNTIKEKCQEDNMIENGPPVVDYENINIFKNMYCAICNNVTDYIPFEIRFYNAKMTAEEMDQFSNLTKLSKLTLLFTKADYELIPPPDVELRTCVAEMIVNNHPLCKKYVNPIVQTDGRSFDVYRNSFCISINERQHMFYCFINLLNFVWQFNEIRSLSVIFSFREPKSYVDDVNSCKEWSIEVERSKMCSHLETYVNFNIHLVYYVISTKNYTDEELVRIGFVSVFPLSVTNLTEFTGLIVIEASESKTMLKVDVTVKVLKKVFHHEKRLLENSFNGRNTNIIIRRGAKEYIVQIENIKDIISMGNQPVEFYLLYYFSFVSVTLEFFLRFLKGKDLYTDFNFDKLCIDQQVTIDVMPNGSFNIDADNVRCPNTDDIGKNLYASIPGSNLENLSISLLLSNLLFIFGIGASSRPRLCYVVGVTLHFLWLTVFAFMSIAVVYIMSNLLAIKSRREVPKRDLVRKRRHITVIDILIPLLIVVSAIVIDQTGPEYWSLGYGGAVCFPNRYPSNVVLFSGPVVLSVGIDFVCLTYIISQICRVRLELRHIRKLNLYRDAQIYLRIVALSGVFWTTGIISAIYEIQWLDILFTILCGLQGFFVAVANLNTSRVQSLKAEPIQKNSTDTKT